MSPVCAIRVYAKSSKKGLAIQNRAAAIKILAEQRAGGLIAAMERAKAEGGPSRKGQGLRSMLEHNLIPIVTAHRWQTMATVPEVEVRRLHPRLKDLPTRAKPSAQG